MKSETYYQRNREKALKYAKSYKDKHRKKIKIANKSYRKKIRVSNRIYFRKRYQNDLLFRLTRSLKVRIYHAIKKEIKSASTIKLIGCNVSFLKDYLQSRFQKDMTWENYGAWHIDHIKPCASFDLANPNEQKLCFHYSNLQPLWATDNKIKGSSLC